MKVKCVLCDIIENIDSNCLQAKRLRNRRIHMYICKTCYARVEKNTNERHASGNFKLYREKKKKNHLI